MAVLENRAAPIDPRDLALIRSVTGVVGPLERYDREFIRKVLGYVDKLGLGRRRNFRKKYLERWPMIKMQLEGRPSPLTQAIGERIDQMFRGVSLAWFGGIKPSDRLNMPNFSFMLLKLFEFMGQEHMSEWLHQLKTGSHLRRNEEWWEQICVFNGWPYIPMTRITFAERRARFRSTDLEAPFAPFFPSPPLAPIPLQS